MGFFGKTILYPTEEHYLSEKEVKLLVSPSHVPYLKQVEEGEVRQAVLARRRADGKISLQQIYEVLSPYGGSPEGRQTPKAGQNQQI